MRLEQETVPVKIGTISLRLPVRDNQGVTVEIAGKVAEKIARIEAESDKMNTLHFVVQAAFEFAAELHDLQKQYDEEEQEYKKAFEHIASQLKEMQKRYHLPSSHAKEDEDAPLEG